ncbi:MAG TPA: DUF5522 domain-containing protein [Chitinophaga sp.]
MMHPKMIEGVDYYLNEQGYMVFTAAYHRKRGFCCGNGCKHCPFAYEKVPEPKRWLLLEQQKARKEGGKQ